MSTKKNKYKNSTKFFMRLALNQAEKCLGNTGVNPAVGCVIVKDDMVIGSGSTGLNGVPHAEINAINSAKSKTLNANMFVTLEPCSHYGKTPPCVNRIIRSKIKKVFFSVYDLDKRSYKKSKNILKKNKIKVINGILKKDTGVFYKSYIAQKSNRPPFISTKLALSKDYFLKSNKNKWITNKFSRLRGHIFRSKHDAILTSSKTIIDDNPTLNCRIKGLEKCSPARFIIDKNLRIPSTSKVVKTARSYKTFVFYNMNKTKKLSLLKKRGVKVIKLPINNLKKFDLVNLVKIIGKMGFARILLEAGLNLNNSFLKNNLINELIIFKSSNYLSKNGIDNFKYQMLRIFKKKNCRKIRVNLNGDVLLLFKIK